MKLYYLILTVLLLCGRVSFSMKETQEVTVVTSDYQSFKIPKELCTVSPVLLNLCKGCYDPSLSPNSRRLVGINSTDFQRILPFLEITHNISNELEKEDILQKKIKEIKRKLILIKLIKSANFLKVELLSDKLVNCFVDWLFEYYVISSKADFIQAFDEYKKWLSQMSIGLGNVEDRIVTAALKKTQEKMRQEIKIGRRDSGSNGDNPLYGLASQNSPPKDGFEAFPQSVM